MVASVGAVLSDLGSIAGCGRSSSGSADRMLGYAFDDARISLICEVGWDKLPPSGVSYAEIDLRRFGGSCKLRPRSTFHSTFPTRKRRFSIFSSGRSWAREFSRLCFWKPSSCSSVELATSTSSVLRRICADAGVFRHQRPGGIVPRGFQRLGALHRAKPLRAMRLERISPMDCGPGGFMVRS